MLVGYVRAYQEVQPLTIGELWAVSITLRIVMIENLRRLAEQIVKGRAARHLADDLADRLLGMSGKEAEPPKVVLADHEDDARSPSFAVQLIHRLRDQDPKITPALTGSTSAWPRNRPRADDLVREVHRRQGATSVTVRNIITSLRLISDVDWKDLFEEVSLVDAALARRQPASGPWISRPAISTAPPSRTSRAARMRPNSISPARPSRRPGAAMISRPHRPMRAKAIPAIISSAAGRPRFRDGDRLSSRASTAGGRGCTGRTGIGYYAGAIAGAALILLAVAAAGAGRAGLRRGRALAAGAARR